MKFLWKNNENVAIPPTDKTSSPLLEKHLQLSDLTVFSYFKSSSPPTITSTMTAETNRYARIKAVTPLGSPTLSRSVFSTL